MSTLHSITTERSKRAIYSIYRTAKRFLVVAQITRSKRDNARFANADEAESPPLSLSVSPFSMALLRAATDSEAAVAAPRRRGTLHSVSDDDDDGRGHAAQHWGRSVRRKARVGRRRAALRRSACCSTHSGARSVRALFNASAPARARSIRADFE